jgi:hypothetical protein
VHSSLPQAPNPHKYNNYFRYSRLLDLLSKKVITGVAITPPISIIIPMTIKT